MFDWLRRRTSKLPWSAAAGGVADWAAARGYRYKGTRTHDGFVVEPVSDGAPVWRLEWGPSHRAYLGKHEVRVRAPVPLPADGHAVVLPRSLQAALEVELYSAFTDQVRTHVDDALPEEVRWLAVSPRLGSSGLGDLREQLGAAGNLGPWLQLWLAGPTGRLLADVAVPQGTPGLPVLFTVQHGQLALRSSMPVPDTARLAELISLFELALAEARRCAAELGEEVHAAAPDSGHSGLSSLTPEPPER